MGEVYRARDTRLDREVAIKVLPAHLTGNNEFKQRLEREAKSISQLTHPHICTLHDIGHQGGVDYLVMEYLEGETLAARLVKGPLPLDQVLKIGTEIASALDKAHRSGVVHRDLKPGNIMLTKTGAKLLDFGLAKSVNLGDPTGLTITKPLTSTGTLLGTFQYMSPEQLEGREADARTDIFAFGAVLYEMATGKRAFEGKSQASLISSIMSSQPAPISQIQPMTPPALDRLVRKCLAKEPDDRWQSAADVADELKWIAEGGPQAGVPAVVSRSKSLRGWLGWSLAVIAVTLLIVEWIRRADEAGPASGPIRVAARLPDELRLNFESFGQFSILAVSPDGSQIAFAGKTGSDRPIYVRSLARFEVTKLSGTRDGSGPFFSPDGKWLGFFANGKLKKIALSGGVPIDLCDVGNHRGGAWGPDGMIVFSPTVSSPLMRMSSEGGAAAELTALDADRHERTHRWPVFLPDGDEVAFTVGVRDKPGNYEDSTIDAISLSTARRRTLLSGACMVRSSPTGHLILGRGDQLYAVALESVSGRRAELSAPLLSGVAGAPSSGMMAFDIARNGTLVYAEKDPRADQFELVWLDREGKPESLGLSPQQYSVPRISPDGSRIAVNVGPGGGGDTDIWIHDLGRGSMTRLTFDARSSDPTWYPDAKRLAFGNPKGIMAKDADGSSEGELLIPLDWEGRRSPVSISSDGGFLLFVGEESSKTSLDVFYWAKEDGQVHVLAQTPAFDGGAELSPDGKWVAYYSDESGKWEVYVQAFPERKGRWQVSLDGGRNVRWSRDGKELFYDDGVHLHAVAVTTSPTFAHGPPQRLFKLDFIPGYEGLTNYDVAADGRFLVVRSLASGSTEGHVNVILNWAGELKTKTAIGTK